MTDPETIKRIREIGLTKVLGPKWVPFHVTPEVADA